MKNRNVIRATGIYLVFFTLIATEHVFEHSYAANILGFDETNLIDLNWYVFDGIVAGCAFTYFTFALRKWRYKTMTAIAFALAIVYLSYFYFFIDYGVEKEMLSIPLFFRGAAAVKNCFAILWQKNAALYGAGMTAANPGTAFAPLGQLYGILQTQALIVSMKEIYGWLLIVAIASLTVILIRPVAIFPQWSTVRRVIKHIVRPDREYRIAKQDYVH